MFFHFIDLLIDIIHSGESISVKKDVKMPVQGWKSGCKFFSSAFNCNNAKGRLLYLHLCGIARSPFLLYYVINAGILC